MKNICIIGIGGMLGQTLSKTMEACGYSVCGYDINSIDICDNEMINKQLSKIKDISYLINCAAITDTTYCNSNKGMVNSYSVNVIGALNLGRYCRLNNIHFIQISTDAVYSEYMQESGVEFPVNVYGLQKLIMEKMLKEEFKDCLCNLSILRSSWLYGYTQNKCNFVDKVISWLQKNTKINVVDDCFGRPMSCEFLSKFIIECIKTSQHGIIDAQPNIHPISRYSFANEILDVVLKIDNEAYKFNIIERVSSEELVGPINQNKSIPHEMIDENNHYHKIIRNIENSDNEYYWVYKYITENYKQIIEKL